MSSNLLSRPFDVSRYGLIFACAQKNMGLSGLTVVIIHSDLLKRTPLPTTPSYLQYAIHAKENSFMNTPPTFAWYLAGLILSGLKKKVVSLFLPSVINENPINCITLLIKVIFFIIPLTPLTVHG